MRVLAFSLMIVLLGVPAYSQTGDPSDELMGLVPADSAIILVLDQLRDRSREIFNSELAQKLAKLPAVRAWLDSEKGKGLVQSRAEIERTLGVSIEQIRDEILGEKVILALHMNPGGKSSEPAGLFLAKARKRATLESLIASLNKAEIAEKTLKTVNELPRRAGVTVYHRHFQPNTKPDEWYCLFDDNTFAWSNSEALISGVVDRKSKPDGLRTSARYQTMRDALPDEAIVRLYLDPVVVAKAASESKAPQDANLIAVLGGFEYIGAAIEWRDGPILHLHQSIDPGKLAVPLAALRSEGELNDVLRRVPRTAVAVATWRWDLPRAYDVFVSLVPESEKPRFKASQTAIEGLLKGKDLRQEILPALKPGGIAYIDIPTPQSLPALVAMFDISENREVAEAMENGLRTVIALVSLDKSHNASPIQMGAKREDGVRVTQVAHGKHVASFVATPKRFVLSWNQKSVGKETGDHVAPSQSDGPIGRMRETYFPSSEGFLAIDMTALHGYADANRSALVRRETENRGGNAEDASRDFERALQLIEPFGGAFLSWSVARDGRSAHQAMGFVGRAGVKAR